jgi:predicted homoserine dehydrogenase-like protein
MHARATRALAPGSVLRIGERHSMPGVEALFGKAQAVDARSPVPYYMAVGCTVTQPIQAGELITRDRVAPPTASALWRLRAEQDRRFFAA